jgi:DNA-binding GntR family transcriptional regulator
MVDKVYAELELMIVTCELAPGALLSEAELSKQFNVSRTPVGEALQRLAREGLVNILPRRGILVSSVSVSDQLQLLELRRDISRFIARVGARRARPDERARLREIATAFVMAAKNDDDAALLVADKEFHDLFVRCAHNVFALRTMVSMDSLSRRFWLVHRGGGGEHTDSARLHGDIARAMADGDAEAAMQASDKLADYMDEFTRSTLDEFTRSTLDAQHALKVRINHE